MKVLVACEYSGRVRDAFEKNGHNAISCDFLDSESPGKHYKGDVMDILYHDWDLVIAHPPYTYLCNSGVRWLYNNDGSKNIERWEKLKLATEFFTKFILHPSKKICIENPIPHKYAKLKHYTQIIQPWQFGHGETKATCLWLRCLPKLIPTNIVDGRVPRIHNMAPKKDRAKERSKTYLGIAQAMADQWG